MNVSRETYLTTKKREYLNLVDRGELHAAVVLMIISAHNVGADAGAMINNIALEAAELGLVDCVRSFIEGFE